MAGKSGGHGAPRQKSEDGARVLIELGRCGRCRWQYGAKNTARHRRCNGRATREINLRPIGGRRANIRDGQVDKFPTIFVAAVQGIDRYTAACGDSIEVEQVVKVGLI